MYVMMFLSHIIKTYEYFAAEGFPEFTIDMLPEIFEAIVFNTAKLLTIYASML